MSEPPKLNLLVAYPYMKKDVVRVIHENINNVRFLLDSGAFTAWKAGKKIGLDDYCKFIEALPFKPWRYFTLDVVGDPAATAKNYEQMLARGLTPIPIFTRGEDPKMLDEYYKTSDVVGIGGLVKTDKNKGFVKGIMRLAAGRKIHLLGFTNMKFVRALKPYMADSSSWQSARMYGSLCVYFGGGDLHQVRKEKFFTDPIDRKLMVAVEQLGFNPYDVRLKKSWIGMGSKIARITGASWIKLSLEAKEKIGTHLFLACGNPTDITVLFEEFNRLTKGYA